MDPPTRNLLILGAVVGALYWWCKTNKEGFTPLPAAPFDGPVDDVSMGAPITSMLPSGTPITGPAASVAPVSAAAAAQQAGSTWQAEAEAINPYASTQNYVDSRAMEGVDSMSGYTRKNSTWDVRGAVPIERDPSVSFFGQSSRLPGPSLNNNVFCNTTT